MGTLEWTIEDISHWNMDINGAVIIGPKTDEIGFYMYPRGPDGIQENMEVRIEKYKQPRRNKFGGSDIDAVLLFYEDWTPSSVELIYASSDNSMVTVKLTNHGDSYKGPEFDNIVDALKNNDPSQPDKLTVRCMVNKPIYKAFVSRISVWDTSVTMPSDTLKNLPYSEEDNPNKHRILNIMYIREDGKQDYLSVLASKFEELLGMTRVHMFLKPDFQANVVSIRVFVSFPQKDDIPRVDGVANHVFRGQKVIQESGRFLVRENASNFVLHLKTASPHKYQRVDLSFPHQKRKVPDLVDSALLKDLMCLYQDQEFSDFQLKCGNVSFPVHRNILSARSPVFKTMLSCDMKESASGCMDIEDLDAPTLGLFLTYLYTGTVRDMQSDSALKLYYAADKYQVPSLKKETSDFLSTHVSFSNVSDVLSLADTHQDEELLSEVHSFILDNYNEVLGSKEWEDLKRRDPILVGKTLTHFGKRPL